MGQMVPKADDLVEIGDLFCRFRIDVPQAKQRFTNDAKIALDNLSHAAIMKIDVERSACRIPGNVLARPHHVIKQLRRFGMHRRSPFASWPLPG